MRLALLTPGFSADEDDECIPAILDLVRTLAQHDDVQVFALRYPHRRQNYQVYGATVHPLGAGQVRGFGRLPLWGRALLQLRQAAQAQRFDVLHALWAHEPGFLAALAGQWTQTPVLVSLLGGELADLPEIDYGGGRSRVNSWLVQRALRQASWVTVGSHWLRQQVLPDLVRAGCAPERLEVLPLGVATERFHPQAAANPGPDLDGRPKLLQVAALTSVKDVATALRALPQIAVRWPDVHLHLVGEGELRQSLEQLAHELGVAARVTFHGAIAHHQLPAWYARADLALVSSRFESQGMVILEAMACGCPVVGTTVGLLPELVPAPWLAPPANPSALAYAVLQALEPVGRPPRVAAVHLHPYSLAVSTERWRRLYTSLTHGSPGTDHSV